MAQRDISRHHRPEAAMAELDLFARAMAAMSRLTGKPLLFGPNGKPMPPLMPSPGHTLRRDAAKNVGSFKNWRPQAVFSAQAEALERAAIADRSADLYNNDPHAAGIIDNMAALVIGFGLSPEPMIDRDALPILTYPVIPAAALLGIHDVSRAPAAPTRATTGPTSAAGTAPPKKAPKSPSTMSSAICLTAKRPAWPI